MTEKAAQARDRARELAARRPSFWKSRSLRLMLVVTLVGLGLWVYALATAPAAPASAGGNQMAAGYAAGLDPGTAPSAARPRLIDESAPATFRFGLSFVVGFFIAWLFRRFIKLTILIAGGIATFLIVLKKTGVLDLDFDAVQSQVDHGVQVAQENASRFKDFILGYLPSGASALTGMFFGARRRT